MRRLSSVAAWAAGDTSHVDEAVDQAGVGLGLGGHAGRMQLVGVGRALIAHRIELGGGDHRGRHTGDVAVQR
ncbi:MAG TPA: hypothetical protein VN213_08640 [Solirubrobacteraceae bacterium]|nr:hypothetical protein [Solirubrobacteraceae bacterium]